MWGPRQVAEVTTLCIWEAREGFTEDIMLRSELGQGGSPGRGSPVTLSFQDSPGQTELLSGPSGILLCEIGGFPLVS